MRFELGGTTFARKADAVTYIRSLLWDSDMYEPITDPALFALLDLHPQREQKVGPGVDWFEVIEHEGSKAFELYRCDGTSEVFSYRECFQPSTAAGDLSAAMRNEIAEQIEAFRISAPRVCALTGVPLVLRSGSDHSAEVDHDEPTFAQLAKAWKATVNGPVPNHDLGTRRALSNPDQAQSWREFHRANARLRLLSRQAHRGLRTKSTNHKLPGRAPARTRVENEQRRHLMALTRASEVQVGGGSGDVASLDLNELGREGAAVLITVLGWGEEKDWGNGNVKPVKARIVALTGEHAGEIDDDALIFKAGIRNKLHEVGQSVVGRLRPYGARKAIGLEAEEDGDVELAEKVLAKLDGPAPEAKTPVTDEVNAAKKKAAERKAAAKKVALDEDDDTEPPF